MGVIRPITVVEVPPFPGQSDKVWTDEERHHFIDFIARNPLEGDEIKGTGGLRKVRWSCGHKGKRGGVRVIYFFYNEHCPIFLLAMYPKNQKIDLSSSDKKNLGQWVRVLKSKLKHQ